MNHLDTVTTYGLDAMSVSAHRLRKTPGKQTTMNHFDTVTSDRSAGNSMNRRHLLKMIGFGAAALAAGIAGTAERTRAQSAVTLYRTTTPLNFRSGPGTSYAVITVIPAGGTVGHAGTVQNSFYEVSYNGTYGWVHKDYLAPASGSSDPVIVGEGRATAAVNLRSGPSTGHQVLRVVAAGTWVKISNTVQNGFRYVVHNGLAGWIADQYLSQSSDDQGGNYKTTTTALNLRAEPSTSASILTIMPAGAKVQLLHMAASGFGNVNYNGMQGWAHLDYLK